MYKLEPWGRVQPCRMEDFGKGLTLVPHTEWEPESTHFPVVCCVYEVTSSHTRRGDGAGSALRDCSGCYCLQNFVAYCINYLES